MKFIFLIFFIFNTNFFYFVKISLKFYLFLQKFIIFQQQYEFLIYHMAQIYTVGYHRVHHKILFYLFKSIVGTFGTVLLLRYCIFIQHLLVGTFGTVLSHGTNILYSLIDVRYCMLPSIVFYQKDSSVFPEFFFLLYFI